MKPAIEAVTTAITARMSRSSGQLNVRGRLLFSSFFAARRMTESASKRSAIRIAAIQTTR